MNDKKKANHKEEEEEKYSFTLNKYRNSIDENEIDEENKREHHDRKQKKKDPEKLKAIFSSSLEHTMIPENISIFPLF